MRPSKVNPTPSMSTNNLEQDTSFPRSSVVLDPSSPRSPPFPDPSSPRGPDLPAPAPDSSLSFPRGSLFLDPSSPRASPFLDPPSPRGSLFLDPPSPRGSLFLDPPSPRGSLFLDPPSPRGSLFLDPSLLNGPPFPGPSTLRGSLLSCSSRGPLLQESSFPRCSMESQSSFRSFLSPPFGSPNGSRAHNHRLLSGSMGYSSLFLGSSFQQMPLKEERTNLKFRVPSIKSKELKMDNSRAPWVTLDPLDWLCALIALLVIFMVLLVMMSLMSLKTRELKWQSKKQMGSLALKNLILTESLKRLQMGKAWTCPMCKIQWMQWAQLCFQFSDLEMSWQLSNTFCQNKSSTLAVIETKEELDFLSHQSHKHFYLRLGNIRYYKYWVGLQYDNSTHLTLGDGTPVEIKQSTNEGPNPCIYLRDGELITKPCYRRTYFICKRKVEFGWI